MFLKHRLYFSLFLLLIITIISCKKNDFNINTPALAEFVSQNTSNVGNYFVTNDPNKIFKIPVGISTVSNVERKINFTVSSTTGATSGTQYTIASNSITIPAGKVVDSIPVKGLFAGYPAGRKDTLILTITGGDVSTFDAFKTYTLVMQKYCDVVEADLIGDYANSIDYYNGSPSATKYKSTVTNWTSTGPTSATVNIKNLGATHDNGWGPFGPDQPAYNPGVLATLDWSNPSNFSVKVAKQQYFNDGTGNSTISGTGSFSSCDNKITINFTVLYAGDGNSYATTSVLNR